MSEANEILIKISEEVDWAEVPNSPTMALLRIISEGLKGRKQTTKSEEITGNRRPRDHIKTGEAAGGPIAGEYSFGTYDLLLEGALCSDFVVVDMSETTISAAAADNSLNDSGNGFIAAGIVAGMWIKISGFTGAPGNNGIAKVLTVAAGKITIANAAAGGITLVNDAAGEEVTIAAKMLRDGAVKKSYLLEKAFEDSDDTTHLHYRGCRVARFRLNVQAQQTLKVEFDLEAEKERSDTVSLDAAPAAATTTDICEAGSNVGSLKEGGAALTALVSQFSVEVNNNLDPIPAVASQTPEDLVPGDCDVSGSISAYFKNKTLHDKFLGHTETSFEHRITDPDGNVTIFTVSAIYYDDSTVAAGGKNQRVMQPLSWVAKEHPATSCQIQIDCLAAA